MRINLFRMGILALYIAFLGYVFHLDVGFNVNTSTVYAASSTTIQYSVVFNANGGKFVDGATSTGSLYAGQNTLVTSFPSNPSKYGYHFMGWYTSSSRGNMVTNGSTYVSGKTTFYAHWEKDAAQYKVQFNANGGRFTDSQSSKREYTFSGTYKTLDSLEAIRVSGLPTKNDVMKSGYEFVGWFTTLSSVGGEQVGLSTVVSSKKTYYARWAKNAVEYQVILDTDGGKFKETNSSSMKFNFRGFNQKLESNSSLIGILVKSDATPEAVLEKSGYKFLGWYTKKSSGGEKINNDLTVNSKTTYYARWNKEAPKYSVIFDYNGGEADSDHKKYKEILVSGVNTRIGTLPTGFSRKGYTLVSTNTWNTKQNGKGSAVTEDATVRARSIFYAQWNKVEGEYPITFHANGGYFDGRQLSVTYSSVNQKITFPETKGINGPIKNGFTRKGTWFTSTGVQVYESTATVPTTVKYPTTYYTHWEKNPDTYDITFDAGLGTFDRDATDTTLVAGTTHVVNVVGDNNEEVKIEFTHMDTLSTVPAILSSKIQRPGHTFVGWFTSQSGGNPVTSTFEVKRDQKIYAQWSQNTYSITIETNGGKFIRNYSTTSTQAFANWGRESCSITATESISKNYTENSTIQSLPSSPTRDGYDFDKWIIKGSASPGTTVDRNTPVTGPFTIQATWILRAP